VVIILGDLLGWAQPNWQEVSLAKNLWGEAHYWEPFNFWTYWRLAWLTLVWKGFTDFIILVYWIGFHWPINSHYFGQGGLPYILGIIVRTFSVALNLGIFLRD